VKITYDSKHRTLLVSGMTSDGWLLFRCHPLEVIDLADSIQYGPLITGLPNLASSREIDAAWELARSSLLKLDDLDADMHEDMPHRFTSRIALYLATKDRVDTWGGFGKDDPNGGERARLPELYNQLSAAEKLIVDERIRAWPSEEHWLSEQEWWRKYRLSERRVRQQR
jgi:hypothetical protein